MTTRSVLRTTGRAGHVAAMPPEAAERARRQAAGDFRPEIQLSEALRAAGVRRFETPIANGYKLGLARRAERSAAVSSRPGEPAWVTRGGLVDPYRTALARRRS